MLSRSNRNARNAMLAMTARIDRTAADVANHRATLSLRREVADTNPSAVIAVPTNATVDTVARAFALMRVRDLSGSSASAAAFQRRSAELDVSSSPKAVAIAFSPLFRGVAPCPGAALFMVGTFR